jgi:hypothetical protein
VPRFDRTPQVSEVSRFASKRALTVGLLTGSLSFPPCDRESCPYDIDPADRGAECTLDALASRDSRTLVPSPHGTEIETRSHPVEVPATHALPDDRARVVSATPRYRRTANPRSSPGYGTRQDTALSLPPLEAAEAYSAPSRSFTFAITANASAT